MRKYKTTEKNRTSYTYFSVDGSKIKIMSDEEGVSNTVIAALHAFDDQAVDAKRRENYHAPVHLESYQVASNADASGRNRYLIDPEPNPLECLIASLDAAEHADRLARLRAATDSLQPQQKALIQKVFDQGRTFVEIAAEEGVTEAAIRNRLKKIFNKLRKKI